MDRNEIKDRVEAFLTEEFEINPTIIADDVHMAKTLDLDSLDYVDMVVIIEENFGFKMTAEDFQQITSFSSFYDFIEARVK